VPTSGWQLSCCVLETSLLMFEDTKLRSTIPFISAPSSRSNLWINWFLNPKSWMQWKNN
jgi:hypothetical protein